MAITAPRPLVQEAAPARTGTAPRGRRPKSRVGLTLRIVAAVLVGIVMAFQLWVMLVTAFSG